MPSFKTPEEGPSFIACQSAAAAVPKVVTSLPLSSYVTYHALSATSLGLDIPVPTAPGTGVWAHLSDNLKLLHLL